MKDTFLRRMVAGVPGVLKDFRPQTGRIMAPGYQGPDKGWAVTHQDVMYPLALLYKTDHSDNPYYGDRKILDVVAKLGDAVRDFQYPDGQVEFIKVDGSKWGPTYMCWTMYHWVETFALLRDDLDEKRLRRWQEGLTLAYDGIAREISDKWRIHNIPTWNGMGLTRAAQVFGRDDWGQVGREMIRRAVAAQTEHGYWNEHGGPTTSYNLVYVHAIGLYHAFTKDQAVLEALRRSLDFHIKFTYPDGALVETIDGRVKYRPAVPDRCIPAYSLFPDGRRFVRWLMQRSEAKGQTANCSPAMASAFQHYVDGDEAPIPQEQDQYALQMGDLARVVRSGEWFYCLSAIAVEPTENRWGMDRQHFVSLYHDVCGLIVGGGNSKDQPAWSNFVVGDQHLPIGARLLGDGVELDYGAARCSLSVNLAGDEAAIICRLASDPPDQPVRVQLLLNVMPEGSVSTGAGDSHPADGRQIKLTGRQAGGWVAYGGWHLRLADDAEFEYPVSPFNPYAKDGAAPIEQAKAVVRMPLRADRKECLFKFTVDRG